MSQTTISGSTTRNNGATVLWGNRKAGNNAVTNTPGKDVVGKIDGLVSGPKVETGAPGASGVKKANSNLNFAKMVSQEYLLMTESTKIGGSANTILVSPGRESATYAPNPNYRSEGRYTRRVVQAGWNYVTGISLTEPTVSNDSFGQDHAARPTLAIPGEGVFQYGSNTPKQFDYKPKTD